MFNIVGVVNARLPIDTNCPIIRKCERRFVNDEVGIRDQGSEAPPVLRVSGRRQRHHIRRALRPNAFSAELPMKTVKDLILGHAMLAERWRKRYHFKRVFRIGGRKERNVEITAQIVIEIVVSLLSPASRRMKRWKE